MTVLEFKSAHFMSNEPAPESTYFFQTGSKEVGIIEESLQNYEDEIFVQP